MQVPLALHIFLATHPLQLKNPTFSTASTTADAEMEAVTFAWASLLSSSDLRLCGRGRIITLVYISRLRTCLWFDWQLYELGYALAFYRACHEWLWTAQCFPYS